MWVGGLCPPPAFPPSLLKAYIAQLPIKVLEFMVSRLFLPPPLPWKRRQRIITNSPRREGKKTTFLGLGDKGEGMENYKIPYKDAK